MLKRLFSYWEVKVTRSKKCFNGPFKRMEFIDIDACIDGDAKEETKEFNCTETTWGVFKAYAFFY